VFFVLFACCDDAEKRKKITRRIDAFLVISLMVELRNLLKAFFGEQYFGVVFFLLSFG
jgi:hypothetical protein